MPQTPQLQRQNRAHFFKSWMRRIAPDAPKEIPLGDTHQDQAISTVLLSPWRFYRPRRTLVPHRVQWVHHRPVAAGFPAPIPVWLTLRAIRCYCKSVTANRPPIQTKWLWRQSLNPGWSVAVVTHAKQRFMSKGFFSFKIWKLARANLCARALIATTLLVLVFLRS